MGRWRSLAEFSWGHAGMLLEGPVEWAKGIEAAVIGDRRDGHMRFVWIIENAFGPLNSVTVQGVIDIPVLQVLAGGHLCDELMVGCGGLPSLLISG